MEQQVERESLKEEMDTPVGEARMVLAAFTFFWFAMPLLQRSRRGAHDGL